MPLALGDWPGRTICTGHRGAWRLASRSGAEMKRGTMKSFSKVALACALFFALAGSAWAAPRAVDAPKRRPTKAPTLSSVAAALDDEIPGTAVPASPVIGTLDETADVRDVFSVSLAEGDRLTVSLTGDVGTDFDVFLYAPDAVAPIDVAEPVDGSAGEEYPEEFSYVATSAGTYYLDAYAYTGSGAYTLTYTKIAAEANDDIPGVAAPASPINDALAESGDSSDVYRVWLNAGETLSVSLSGAAGTDFDVYLYAPDATSVYVDDSVAGSDQEDVYPETFDYPAPSSGFYFLEAYAYTGSGAYSLSYSVAAASPLKPVYRFYNLRNGSHFYTASLAEKNSVQANLSDTYHYEGPAYVVNTANALNSSPLYRFYNKKNGSHFYTASLAEKNSVQANLSATYAYDGPAYNVCLTPEHHDGLAFLQQEERLALLHRQSRREGQRSGQPLGDLLARRPRVLHRAVDEDS